MFIRLTSILLVFVLLSASSTQLVFFAGYQLNKEYISKVLCENKARPKLQCKGKCYLSKKISQAEEKDQKQGTISKNTLEVFITQHSDFRCFTFQIEEYLIHPNTSYFFASVITIFQPPKV